jgi:Uma2 family endonuclease
MPIPQHRLYTADEYFKLTADTDELSELIDGEIVAMASPSTVHQDIVGGLYFAIRSYIQANGGNCKPMISPYDVKLDDYNVVIPDVSVICDRTKIDGKRCNGSPDWIIEVVSSNWKDDYIRKLALYESFGVREYWIVDPQKQTTFVYYFEDKNVIGFYNFDKPITVNIYRENSTPLVINLRELLDF